MENFFAETLRRGTMPYRPPKGIRPPQLEGKRTGRPKGSKNWASAWRDVQWALGHCYDPKPDFPSPAAAVWWLFAQWNAYELEEFLEEKYGKRPEPPKPPEPVELCGRCKRIGMACCKECLGAECDRRDYFD
jgi:hypothetical protein